MPFLLWDLARFATSARANFSCSIWTASTREAAEKQVERMAREILANPVIEEFRYEIVE